MMEQSSDVTSTAVRAGKSPSGPRPELPGIDGPASPKLKPTDSNLDMASQRQEAGEGSEHSSPFTGSGADEQGANSNNIRPVERKSTESCTSPATPSSSVVKTPSQKGTLMLPGSGTQATLCVNNGNSNSRVVRHSMMQLCADAITSMKKSVAESVSSQSKNSDVLEGRGLVGQAGRPVASGENTGHQSAPPQSLYHARVATPKKKGHGAVRITEDSADSHGGTSSAIADYHGGTSSAIGEFEDESDTEDYDEEAEPSCIPVWSSFSLLAKVVIVTMTSVATWSGYIIPLYLSFKTTYSGLWSLSWDDIVLFSQILDAVYFVCICTNFCIAFVDEEHKEEVYVPIAIMYQRISKLSFWVDFLSCAPVTIDNAVFNVFKMCRTYRLLTVSVTFQHLQFRAAVQIGRMVYSVLFAAHLLGCAWYYVIEVDQGLFYQYLDKNYHPDATPSPYLVAYRDAVFMMFNRPTLALNDKELLINIAMAPVGAIVLSSIFGNINWLFQRMNARSMKHFEELSTVEQALKSLPGIPGHLTQRILDYYRYLQIHHDNRIHDALLKGLSPTLLLELKLYLYADLLCHAPFFKEEVPTVIIKSMVMVLNLCIYSSGDFVIHRNEAATAMFFIVQGSTEVLVELDKPPVITFSKGQYFGEMALFRSVEKNAKRTAWVRAVTFCHLARLARDHFEDILNEFPQEHNLLLQKIGDNVAASNRFAKASVCEQYRKQSVINADGIGIRRTLLGMSIEELDEEEEDENEITEAPDGFWEDEDLSNEDIPRITVGSQEINIPRITVGSEADLPCSDSPENTSKNPESPDVSAAVMSDAKPEEHEPQPSTPQLEAAEKKASSVSTSSLSQSQQSQKTSSAAASPGEGKSSQTMTGSQGTGSRQHEKRVSMVVPMPDEYQSKRKSGCPKSEVAPEKTVTPPTEIKKESTISEPSRKSSKDAQPSTAGQANSTSAEPAPDLTKSDSKGSLEIVDESKKDLDERSCISENSQVPDLNPTPFSCGVVAPVHEHRTTTMVTRPTLPAEDSEAADKVDPLQSPAAQGHGRMAVVGSASRQGDRLMINAVGAGVGQKRNVSNVFDKDSKRRTAQTKVTIAGATQLHPPDLTKAPSQDTANLLNMMQSWLDVRLQRIEGALDDQQKQIKQLQSGSGPTIRTSKPSVGFDRLSEEFANHGTSRGSVLKKRDSEMPTQTVPTTRGSTPGRNDESTSRERSASQVSSMDPGQMTAIHQLKAQASTIMQNNIASSSNTKEDFVNSIFQAPDNPKKKKPSQGGGLGGALASKAKFRNIVSKVAGGQKPESPAPKVRSSQAAPRVSTRKSKRITTLGARDSARDADAATGQTSSRRGISVAPLPPTDQELS